MFSADPNHIIAIGASADGMEEINSFFDHTPLDGVSYVIIQHLSADFKSQMVELLARHSKLVVKEAKKIDGYLFLGSIESPMPIIKDLEVVNKKWKN